MANEPARDSNINSLVSYVRDRVLRVMTAMIMRGFDPVLYETKRTKERQQWLYGKGRTHAQCKSAGVPVEYANPKADIVTYTLISKHIVGKAADIISCSKLWNHPAFFKALREEAAKEGLKTLSFEGCHIEWS
jgi:peptidoglycan L-alanyl-D-glutamate endopeptidase CwlK